MERLKPEVRGTQALEAPNGQHVAVAELDARRVGVRVGPNHADSRLAVEPVQRSVAVGIEGVKPPDYDRAPWPRRESEL